MPVLSLPVVALGAALIAYLFVTWFARRRAIQQFKRQNNCGEIAKIPQLDPILGSDMAIKAATAVRSNQFLNFIADLHKLANTGSCHVMGQAFYSTIEPENVKAMLATQFKDFCLGSNRRYAFNPLLGTGIFTADGAYWEHSRAMVRPSFTRQRVADLDTFEVHVTNLINQVPLDGSTVDLQKLFFRLTIDSATEFLFGESVHSLLAKEGEVDFAEAFSYSQDICTVRIRMGALTFLHYDPKFKRACKEVQSFADRFVQKALALKRDGKLDTAGEHGYVFLYELAKVTSDPRELRDQLLNILLAGRDTTASLLSNMFLQLSKSPDLWERLQAEVAELGDERPTFERMKDMKFLRNLINESLRLWPVVPFNAREATCDTTLPVGGGPDQKQPVFVPKGMPVLYHTFAMHRRKDIWGEDADQFNVDRWENAKPGWEFIPFNGGPRICIGQQFALTETMYTTIRICQAFSGIASRDSQEWHECVTLTLCSKNGTQVAMTPRKH